MIYRGCKSFLSFHVERLRNYMSSHNKPEHPVRFSILGKYADTVMSKSSQFNRQCAVKGGEPYLFS
jgi:hypothetical protein